MNTQILNQIKELTQTMSQQEQADFIWEIISQTTLKDATMTRIDGGYEIILELLEDEEVE